MTDKNRRRRLTELNVENMQLKEEIEKQNQLIAFLEGELDQWKHAYYEMENRYKTDPAPMNSKPNTACGNSEDLASRLNNE